MDVPEVVSAPTHTCHAQLIDQSSACSLIFLHRVTPLKSHLSNVALQLATGAGLLRLSVAILVCFLLVASTSVPLADALRA